MASRPRQASDLPWTQASDDVFPTSFNLQSSLNKAVHICTLLLPLIGSAVLGATLEARDAATVLDDIKAVESAITTFNNSTTSLSSIGDNTATFLTIRTEASDLQGDLDNAESLTVGLEALKLPDSVYSLLNNLVGKKPLFDKGIGGVSLSGEVLSDLPSNKDSSAKFGIALQAKLQPAFVAQAPAVNSKIASAFDSASRAYSSTAGGGMTTKQTTAPTTTGRPTTTSNASKPTTTPITSKLTVTSKTSKPATSPSGNYPTSRPPTTSAKPTTTPGGSSCPSAGTTSVTAPGGTITQVPTITKTAPGGTKIITSTKTNWGRPWGGHKTVTVHEPCKIKGSEGYGGGYGGGYGAYDGGY